MNILLLLNKVDKIFKKIKFKKEFQKLKKKWVKDNQMLKTIEDRLEVQFLFNFKKQLLSVMRQFLECFA